jgi:ankyrin repeat protein
LGCLLSLQVQAAISKKTININCQDKKQKSALSLAAKRGHLQICEELIKAKIDSDSQDENGNTALIIVCDSTLFGRFSVLFCVDGCFI